MSNRIHCVASLNSPRFFQRLGPPHACMILGKVKDPNSQLMFKRIQLNRPPSISLRDLESLDVFV